MRTLNQKYSNKWIYYEDDYEDGKETDDDLDYYLSSFISEEESDYYLSSFISDNDDELFDNYNLILDE